MQDAAAQQLRVGECLEYGWDTFKLHIAPNMLVAFVVLLATAVANGVLSFVVPPPVGIGASWLFNGLCAGALMTVALVAARGGEPQLQDAWRPIQERPGDHLIVGVAICAGVLLCFVGGLITSLLFMFAPLLVVEGRDFKQALVQSKDLVLTHTADVVVLYLLLLAINLAGALLCGLGLLVSLPVSALALVRAHEQLASQHEAPSEPLQPVPQPPPSEDAPPAT